jgi:cytochrome b561
VRAGLTAISPLDYGGDIDQHQALSAPTSVWRNSRERYGTVAQALHWIIAALFLVAYVAVYYRQWFTAKEAPENWIALQTHLNAGITIAVFVVLRVYWRFVDLQPVEPTSLTRFEQIASRWMHRLLYAVMIVMPISGYLGTGAPIQFFGLFDIPSLKDTQLFQSFGVSWEEFEKPFDFIHKQSGAYVVWVLIAVHAGAALYHHFAKRDDVMLRMLPPRGS